MAATEYLTIAEVSALTGLTRAHLGELRYRGEGPVYLKPTPRTVRYRRRDVIEWMERNERKAA